MEAACIHNCAFKKKSAFFVADFVSMQNPNNLTIVIAELLKGCHRIQTFKNPCIPLSTKFDLMIGKWSDQLIKYFPYTLNSLYWNKVSKLL